MKYSLLLFLISITLYSQKTVEDYGYKSFQIDYLGNSVEFIVKSKKGEDNAKKPLFIFIQGSLAKPLIKYNDKDIYFSPFPFSEKLLLDDYHLLAINKPGVPLIENKKHLSSQGEFVDSKTGLPTEEYTENYNLEYLTQRNLKVIEFLSKKSWVDTSRSVVAGHSEGSSIAVQMALGSKDITHLIYSGGSIYFPRILSMISQDRQTETKEQSWVETDFDYWKSVNNNREDTSRAHGFNSYKGTYSFSKSLNDDLKKLEIPILISYGTEDTASPYNDLFRLEAIQEKKFNIDFLSYIDLEHNYFPMVNNQVDYSEFGWDSVVKDWLEWIGEH